MEAAVIRQKVKEVISNVADIPPDEIPDNVSFIDDLGLDSLTLLEIGVDIDFEFKLNVSDEELQELLGLQQTVDFVQARLAQPQEMGAS